MDQFILMDEWLEKVNPLLAEGKTEDANKITQSYLANIPEPTNANKFAFMLTATLIKSNFKVKQFEKALKWCEDLLKFDLIAMDRYDDGEREFYTGATYFELNDFENARKYLSLADKKSKGRSLKLFNDMKYAKFLKEK